MDGDIRMFDLAGQDDAERDRKWRVVMTNTNAERTAKANIRALGFETYLPMAVTERPRTARRPAATVVRPFLRGYLFVRFDTRRDDWGELFTTIGIKGILRAGGVPLSVPDEVIASIRQQEEAGLIKLSDPPIWSPGARVRAWPWSDPRRISMLCSRNCLTGIGPSSSLRS
ncbi:hypothetical protein CSW58_10785 [Caulobacter sp. B11]|uniref:transcription termination/antitermination protein NusG n=1 Tax=Caulobacter sp. B11 TaxID=2048899 RepID=UPI000C12C5C4|nr:transcription termination/antitermination NusG family protein [Caulobacter sp. B11]PHY12712.1 hypothetical protein CSW58_10785 [Caulobacter sp. B11]